MSKFEEIVKRLTNIKKALKDFENAVKGLKSLMDDI